MHFYQTVEQFLQYYLIQLYLALPLYNHWFLNLCFPLIYSL